jgi:hypothetical protein
MFVACTSNLVEIINVGEEGKPPKKIITIITNLPGNAKIHG